LAARARSARAFVVVPLLAALAAALSSGCHRGPLFAPSGSAITLSSTALILPLNGTATITATVTKTGGAAVQNGTTVMFSTTLGSFSASEVTTNDGKAVVTFNAGSQSGTAVITAYSGSATSSGTSGGTSGSVSIVIGAAAVNNLVVTASPASVSQLGTTPSTITATVFDGNNNPVPGALVQFSTDQGTLSAVSASTNASGQATTQLTTAQAATVTATVGSKSSTVKVSVYAAPTVTITPPTQPTALLAAAFTLTVTPGTGAAAITNVLVNFGDGGAGSTVDLGAVSGTLTVSHAYANPGQYTFTATVKDGSGQTVSASAPVTVYAAVPFTLSVSAAPNTVIVNQTTTVVTATPNAGAPSVVSYTWDFGDGTTPASTTVPFVSHIYTAVPNGTSSQQVVVTVTATGSDGRVGYGSVLVTVNKGT
jgi:hypothetical protein